MLRSKIVKYFNRAGIRACLDSLQQVGGEFINGNRTRVCSNRGIRACLDSLLQSHKEVKTAIEKLFPLYDDLKVIYTKRATGLKASLLHRNDEEAILYHIHIITRSNRKKGS